MSKVLKGTVEIAVNEKLEVWAGFTSDECVDAIKNTSMRKKVLAYRKAVNNEINSKWDQAKAVGSMTDEMRKEFGDDSRVAEFLGISKSTFSKLQRAGKIALEAQKKGIELPSYDTIIELLCVENAKHGNQNLLECAKYVKEHEMTRDEVRDYAKSFVKKEEKCDVEKDDDNEVDDESFASETEDVEEVRWLDFLQITEKELLSMNFESLSSLKVRIIDLLTEYNVNIDNVWIR